VNSPLGALRAGIAVFALAALAACGGGGGSSAIPSTGPSPASLISQNGTTITASGTITAISSSGFMMLVGGGYGQIHVYTNSSTSITGTLTVNEAVLVVGTGTITTSITATSVTPQTSSSPTPPPTSSTPAPVAPSAAPTGALIAIPASVTVWSGTVYSNAAGSMLVNTGKGLVRVYINSGTTIFGGSLAVGQYVRVTATGQASTGLTGVSISISAAAPPNVSAMGQVIASTPYGFTLSSGGSNVPITLSSSTIVGGAPLTVNSNVTVNGVGATSTSINAVQVIVSVPTPPPALATPTPGPIAQKHVLTEDFLGGRYGTHNIVWSQAAPYVNYAQTNGADATAIASYGIKTQFYTDPNRTIPGVGDPMAISDETAYAHDCSGNRITYNYNGQIENVMDISSTALRNRFTSYVSSQMSQYHYDVMFEDDAGPLGDLTSSLLAYGLPCSYSDSAWLSAGQSLDSISPMPVIFNGLGLLSGHNPSQSIGLLSDPNTIGGNYEHCFSDNATPKMTSWLWSAIENTQLQVTSRNKLFVCNLRNTADGSTQTDARLYAIASFLLTYSPQNSMYWSEFATSTGLHVFPEQQLVPLDPLVPAPSDVSTLLTSTGNYAREYAHCYIAGQFVSRCAIVVNPDSGASHTFPLPQYQHTLVLSGSGVLESGTLSTNGPPPPMSLAPGSAAIVFP